MSEGRTVETLIADTLEGLRQPALNYNRYSRTSILSALNLANQETAVRLKCLHGFAVIILKAGYAQYPPPADMLDPKDAYFYQSAASYVHLTREGWKSRSWLDRFLGGWRTNNGDPNLAFIGDSSGNLRKIGFTPRPDTNGSNYLITPDTGVVISVTGLTTTGNITGQNTTANATICTDSLARTMSALGITVGMMALNVTDGSKGQITAVSGATFTVTLAGGVANTWAISDSFTVLAGEYGVVTRIDGDEEYIFSSDRGELIAINALTGNVYLEYYRKPLALTVDGQYPEVPEETHIYLPEYAIWWLKRRSAPGSDDRNDAMVAKQAYDEKIPPAKYIPVDRAVEVSQIRFNW